MTASANAKELAVVIAHAIYDGHRPVLRAIGAGAVNQAVKACVIARGYCSTRGKDLLFRPGFVEVPGDGIHNPVDEMVSAISILVVPT